jgi:flagellin FlaB
MNRRSYVLGLASAATVLAGCNSLPGSDDTGDGNGNGETDPEPVQTLRQYYSALDAGNVSAANDLIHSESPAGTVVEDNAEYYREEISLSVESASLVERGDGRATVDVTVVIEQTETGQTQERSLVVELRQTDAGWRLYDERTQEPTRTTPETTSEPPQQVSARVDVVGKTGTDIGDDGIGVVELAVGPTPGGGTIDLSALTVEWVDSEGVYRLTYGSQPSSETFAVEAIRDDNDSLSGGQPVLDADEDRALLRFAVRTFRGSGLPEGETVSVNLTTGSGGTTEAVLTVPDTVGGAVAVRL